MEKEIEYASLYDYKWKKEIEVSLFESFVSILDQYIELEKFVSHSKNILKCPWSLNFEFISVI